MNKKIEAFRVRFDRVGSVRRITVVRPLILVTLDYVDMSATGIARCGKDDEFDAQVGIGIAYRRALKKLAELAAEIEGEATNGRA